MPRKQVDYQGRTLSEMDVDAILERRPQLALVDELAHTNAPGCRHAKRWQDVEELLAAGIDVFSTVNVQHIESLNDVVASFTKVRVRETVPDRIVEEAELEVVDIPPDELIERLKEGKVYIPEEATRALGHFFSKSNLSALRELALRRAAQAVDTQMLDYIRAHALAGNWAAGERIVVAVSELPGSKTLIRAAKRLADAQGAPWTAVYIETPRSLGFTPEQRQQVAENMQLAAQLGANVASVAGPNVVEPLKAFLDDVRATQLVVGQIRPLEVVRASAWLGGRPPGSRDARRRGPRSSARGSWRTSEGSEAANIEPWPLGIANWLPRLRAARCGLHRHRRRRPRLRRPGQCRARLPYSGAHLREPLRDADRRVHGHRLSARVQLLLPATDLHFHDPGSRERTHGRGVHRRRDRHQPAGVSSAEFRPTSPSEAPGRTPRSQASLGCSRA